MHCVSRFALGMDVRPFRDQIIRVIGETLSSGCDRAPLDRKTRTVALAHTLVWSIHHNEMHRPESRWLNLRDQYSLTAAATIFLTCFNSHDNSPLSMCGQNMWCEADVLHLIQMRQ